MKNKLTGKEIKAIGNNSEEAKRVNRVLKYPFQLYRVDYGDNGLRIYFGISQQYRLVDIVAIDLKHTHTLISLYFFTKLSISYLMDTV